MFTKKQVTQKNHQATQCWITTRRLRTSELTLNVYPAATPHGCLTCPLHFARWT